MDQKSQSEQIAGWLQRGYGITPMDALENFGCFRLGARIYDLRKAGMDIVTEIVTTTRGKHVARYRRRK